MVEYPEVASHTRRVNCILYVFAELSAQREHANNVAAQCPTTAKLDAPDPHRQRLSL